MKRLTLLLLLLNLPVLHGAELPSIAVADFTGDQWHTKLSDTLPDLVADALVNSKRFDVYERSKIDTLIREQGLQASGVVDSQSAVALGKVAGVRYILTGQIIDYGSETKDFAGYGVRTRTSIYRLKAGIKVIDVQTGKVLFSRKDGAEQRLDEGRAMNSTDSTLATKLADEVAGKLVKALLEDETFKSPAEATAATLVPVEITSVPDHADVEVDGVFVGNAGGEVKMPAGQHLITVSLPGYEKWSKRVLVRDGLSFQATLTKKTDKRIEIQTEQ